MDYTKVIYKFSDEDITAIAKHIIEHVEYEDAQGNVAYLTVRCMDWDKEVNLDDTYAVFIKADIKADIISHTENEYGEYENVKYDEKSLHDLWLQEIVVRKYYCDTDYENEEDEYDVRDRVQAEITKILQAA